MTAQVIIYPQPTHSICWTTPSTEMSQDDRQQYPFTNGAYSWTTHMSYSSLPEYSASYDNSGYSGTYGYSHSSGGNQYSATNCSQDLSGVVNGGPPWVDIPLDPNAIYHMPAHGSGWSGSVNSDSPYERDREVLRQAWEQRIRDNWFRRNGVTALPTDTQYDRFIPELRAGEYAERYFGRPEAQLGVSGRQPEEIRVPYPTTQPASHSPISPTVIDEYQLRVNPSQYDLNTSDLRGHMPQETQPPANYPVAADNSFAISPPGTSGQLPASHLLQLPYRDPPTPLSPTDASSPASLYPNAYFSQHSTTSPATVFSQLDSEGAESPLSEIHETRSTSPAGSASAIYTVSEDPSTSKSAAKADSTHCPPMITRSRSLEGASTGQSGMGPVRRGNSTSERGKNAVGTIRVHRPAGIKWNQRTRCSYVNPVTGLQCRTSAGRGPDLERHLRTVHLREEARAVSDGLIPRDKAELLPPDWVMGDRLDFDCPHCTVRFTREDARDRHVKVQHQK
ncbi:hypothetical protein V565_112440 [Rhizoctonia solani 123E]|uniref:C2H2-type domain-containing protein n=1 Tax=Rhizoctonia solani 123E TaxID=1423351 RepID=A0A074RW96_9AGAM|nr:hypothetical protein V565_112440 [Rhizoctonia solani 123E]